MSKSAVQKSNKYGSFKDALTGVKEEIIKENARKELKRKENEKRLAEEMAKLQEKVTDNTISVSQKSPIELIKDVEELLNKRQYQSAESLLRHVYRVTSSMPARQALASARRICKAYLDAEGKWTKRRALLLRKNASKAKIAKEKEAFLPAIHFKEILDFLATAILEIGESEEKEQGEFYGNLIRKQEVILPPLIKGDTCVIAKAPIFFNSTSVFNERQAFTSLRVQHQDEPDIKKLDRGFHLYRNAHLVGVAKKLKPEVVAALVSEKIKKPVSVVNYSVVHKSSNLFWYLYNFPINIEAIYFADSPLIDKSASSAEVHDKYWDIENRRINAVRDVSIRLKELREMFLVKNMSTVERIKSLNNALDEVNEKQRPIAEAFYVLTSLDHSEENPLDRANRGLHIGQYRRLYEHYTFLYNELSRYVFGGSERLKLRQTLFDDRMKARNLYYDYIEVVEFKRALALELKKCQSDLDNSLNIARGTGKKYENMLDSE